MDRYRGFEVRLLCGAGGAEISGVDASRPISGEVVAELRRALAEHCVIFLRDQQLEPEQQKEFARHFGPLAATPFIKPLDGHPEMMRIVREASETRKLNFGGRWHTDMTFSPEPVMGTCLYSRESPAVGGDTVWSNQMLAFEALSPAMQRMLEKLRVMHSAKRSYGPQGAYADDDLKSMRIKASEEALREQAHPCIRSHPDTGRSILYVNWVYAVRFEDMTEEESAPLLDFLNRHSQRPEFQIRFRWTQGTLALWDNRSTQHIAVNDYPGYRRVMDRVTIAGDKPYFREKS
jgi:taurine dioxygenase